MIIPIILSGGNGTRLWPMSRKSKPKQFIEFIDGETMFTQTIKRFDDKKHFFQPIILGNINHEDLIDKELKKNKLKKSKVVLEPKAKNTAPAIAGVIEFLHQSNMDDEIVVFVPADAYIGDIKNFQSYLEEGEEIAKNDKIVCFGIKPIYPETGYGYIKLDSQVGENSFLVNKFVEKPNFEKAVEFLKEGCYLWNAGIFMAKVSLMRKLFKKFQKKLYSNIEKTIESSLIENNKVYLNKDIFEKSEEISIDYAIIENLDASNLAVIAMNIDWSDLGSFQSLYDIKAKRTGEKNIISGHVVLNNTENCLIKSSKKLICCSDLDDLVIIEEKDTILIMKKDKSQNVKKLVEKLKGTDFESIL